MKLTKRRSIVTCAMSPVSSAPLPSAPRAVQHGGAGEMSAGAQQQHIVGDAMAFAGPVHDGGMRPCHPLAVIGMQIDRHAAEASLQSATAP